MERCDINKIACSHNDEVDASTSGHPHLPRQFIPYFLAHRLARKNMKKCLLRLVFPSDSGI